MKTQSVASVDTAPVILSQFAEKNYTNEDAVIMEDTLAELYNLRDKKRSFKGWMVEKQRNKAPKEFYVMFMCKCIDLTVNTYGYGKAGLWRNTHQASTFVKKKIEKTTPQWERDYTFGFSFIETVNGHQVMLCSIQRKATSLSDFMEVGGKIKHGRAATKDESRHTLTHYELEAAIIDGKMDNVNFEAERFITQKQNELSELSMEISIHKKTIGMNGEFYELVKRYKKKSKFLHTVRSRRAAYNQYTDVEQLYDTRADGYGLRPEEALNEFEQTLRQACWETDRDTTLEHLMDANNPEFILDDETAEGILATDYDDEQLDMLHEGLNITNEELMEEAGWIKPEQDSLRLDGNDIIYTEGK